MRFKHILLILAGFCAIQPSIRQVHSCSVPVFRYALERWRPDPYKGIYIYRNEISQKDRAILDQLKQIASNPDYPLNLLLREVDVNTFPEEKLTDLLKGPSPDSLPVLAIWYPGQMGKSLPLWVVPPDSSFIRTLVDAPKRRQIAESLIKGDSVVWVFIPSGNTDKDERAEALMRRELDVALRTYKNAPFTILSGSQQKKLSYGFPILTLSSEDPAERVFVDLLLKSEPDLYEYTDQPMVFPVFGRGRVLGCLFGDYINEKNIREASAFLAGSCSCEVKELNPGFDLLMAAPWDMVVMNAFVEDTPLPELTGVMPDETVKQVETVASLETPEAKSIDSTTIAGRIAVPATAVPVTETRPVADKEWDTGILKIYGITLGSVLVVVAFGGYLLSHHRKKNS
ncbi:MAG: hypothetical protein P8Y80_10095 [Acidobacteriota bacterium]